VSTVAQGGPDLAPAGEPGIAARAACDGRLEGVIDGVAVGWAHDPTAPHRRLQVGVLVDGELVAKTAADIPRESLVREGIGDGRHGFCVELPAHLQDGARHTAGAVVLASGEPLRASSPFAMVASAAAPEWAGTRFQPAAQSTSPTSLRQRPSTQAQFPRREPAEGFSGGPDAETIVLNDHVTVERSQPLHFSIQHRVADPAGERHRRLGEHGREYLAERLFVSRLPGALVDSGRFVISPTEHQYLLDSFRHGGRHAQGLTRWGYTHVEGNVYEREIDRIEARNESVVVLGAQTNLNYSHWLLESVARALLFRPFDDGAALYLTPHHLQPWQHEALLLAGVPPERILPTERRKLLRFREVFAVSRGMSGIPMLIPDAVSALATLTEAVPVSSPAGQPPARRRLYVSRAQVQRRHISNEADLVEMLAHHGFEAIHPQTLTVRQQIELFAGAEAVIGSFGSGLTNLIFSPPGTLALELQPEDVDFGGNAFVWNLTSIREQRFAQVVCPVTEGMRHLPLDRRDMTVDVAHIDELLPGLLAGQAGN
jgi:hypothetical protein